jgi:hypothetical protein
MARPILRIFEEHFATSIPLHPIPPRNYQSLFGSGANANSLDKAFLYSAGKSAIVTRIAAKSSGFL